MKKFMKRAAVVSLAAVMSAAACASFVGCGNKEDISVYIFAGESDMKTNTDIVENWAKKYAQKLIEDGVQNEGFEIKTKVTFDADTGTYFQNIAKSVGSGSLPDIFYVSPKYVKTYAQTGVVLDLSETLLQTEGGKENLSGVWPGALGLYSYSKNTGEIGLEVEVKDDKVVNANDNQVGVYALPKDYSSFGLAYNGKWFTDEMKKAYTTSSVARSDSSDDVIVSADGSNNIINIGVPTTYKPYNFYRYKSFSEAIQKGDSTALMSEAMGGYTVTIPGWPGETFTLKEEDRNKDVTYDASIGYITYTFAEYSALGWACAYYINQIMKNANPVYVNDQYEGTLYFLPWLHGNGANYINPVKDDKGADAYTSVSGKNSDGTNTTYTMPDRFGNDVTYQYGINSDKFVETYAAFTAYGSDWVSNSYYCSDIKDGGWTSWNNGTLLFYGCGTWDMPSLNQVEKTKLDYQCMPLPVGEDYALYSKIKDASYNAKEYPTNATKKTEPFSEEEIYENQVKRQNKWAARVDSVGYGVSAAVKNDKRDWKEAACVNLVAELTIEPETQVQLTYAGSQLPNYVGQCADYLYYNKEGREEGAFKNMTTPDDNTWNTMVTLAKTMVADTSETTIGEWLSDLPAGFESVKGIKDSYNKNYTNDAVSTIKDTAAAFKVLNMISFNYASRNLLFREVDGTNSVTDAAMYTYSDAWLTKFVQYKVDYLLAYNSVGKHDKLNTSLTKLDDMEAQMGGKIMITPACYCASMSSLVQESLNLVREEEQEFIESLEE